MGQFLKAIAPYIRSIAIYVLPEMVRYVSMRIIKIIKKKEKEIDKNE